MNNFDRTLVPPLIGGVFALGANMLPGPQVFPVLYLWIIWGTFYTMCTFRFISGIVAMVNPQFAFLLGKSITWSACGAITLLPVAYEALHWLKVA
jgi:hypothetical protein